MEVFLLISYNLSNDYDNELFEEGICKVNYVYYENKNPKAKEHLTTLFAEYLQKHQSKKAKVSILLKNQNGFDLKTHMIKPFRIDFERMYNDDFLEIHNNIKYRKL